MTDVEKQSSLPTRGSSYEGANISPPNSMLQSETPLVDATEGEVRCRRKAWLAVLGGFFALYCSFGQLSAFGTFQTWYSTHQLASSSLFTISWIGSLQLLMFFVMGGPIGCAFDAYGPTRLLCSGLVVLTTSLVLTSVSVHFYQYLLAQGFLFGLGVALLFYPSISCVAMHFNEYRATTIGIVFAGSGCGGVVHPIMLRYLFNAVGFGWAVRVSAVVTAFCGAVAVLTVRLQRPVQHKRPLLPDVRTLRDARFLLLILGSFFVCLGLFTPFFYISTYAESRHLSANAAFGVLSVMNAGSVLGRVAPAYVSDKLGRFNLLCPSAFLAGLSCLVLWTFSRDLVAIELFAAVYGMLSGAFTSMVTPCVAQISDMRAIGMRIGVLYMFISVPSLFGSPIAGALVQRQHEAYTASIALAGSSMILGSVFLLCSKLMIDRRFFCRV